MHAKHACAHVQGFPGRRCANWAHLSWCAQPLMTTTPLRPAALLPTPARCLSVWMFAVGLLSRRRRQIDHLIRCAYRSCLALSPWSLQPGPKRRTAGRWHPVCRGIVLWPPHWRSLVTGARAEQSVVVIALQARPSPIEQMNLGSDGATSCEPINHHALTHRVERPTPRAPPDYTSSQPLDLSILSRIDLM